MKCNLNCVIILLIYIFIQKVIIVHFLKYFVYFDNLVLIFYMFTQVLRFVSFHNLCFISSRVYV